MTNPEAGPLCKLERMEGDHPADMRQADLAGEARYHLMTMSKL